MVDSHVARVVEECIENEVSKRLIKALEKINQRHECDIAGLKQAIELLDLKLDGIKNLLLSRDILTECPPLTAKLESKSPVKLLETPKDYKNDPIIKEIENSLNSRDDQATQDNSLTDDNATQLSCPLTHDLTSPCTVRTVDGGIFLKEIVHNQPDYSTKVTANIQDHYELAGEELEPKRMKNSEDFRGGVLDIRTSKFCDFPSNNRSFEFKEPVRSKVDRKLMHASDCPCCSQVF